MEVNRRPDLSIIIPTHNRRELLGSVLESLAVQTYPSHLFEVVVVADACLDGTELMVQEKAADLPYVLKVVSHAAKSPSLTRNRGVQEARSQRILFLDDDIIASKNLVAAHMEYAGANQVVLGYSKPVVPEHASWWQRNARLWWEDGYHERSCTGYRFTYRDFYSGNVSFSADLFNSVGGFSPQIHGRLEDYELGYRLLATGAQFVFQPAALGAHHDYTDLDTWLRRVRQEGEADVQISRVHIELANSIFREPFEAREQVRNMIRQLAFQGSVFADLSVRAGYRVAKLCEFFRVRGAYWHVTGALREFHYWLGVAGASGSARTLDRMLQEAPLPRGVDIDAPELDFAELPDEETVSYILQVADRSGLRVMYDGAEVLALAPVTGAERLRLEHVERKFRDYLQNNFLPALAMSAIRDSATDHGH